MRMHSVRHVADINCCLHYRLRPVRQIYGRKKKHILFTRQLLNNYLHIFPDIYKLKKVIINYGTKEAKPILLSNRGNSGDTTF